MWESKYVLTCLTILITKVLIMSLFSSNDEEFYKVKLLITRAYKCVVTFFSVCFLTSNINLFEVLLTLNRDIRTRLFSRCKIYETYRPRNTTHTREKILTNIEIRNLIIIIHVILNEME